MEDKNLRNDRIDVIFRDSKFQEILSKWKSCCERYGGQTARLKYLINLDLKKIKEDIKNEVDKI